MDGNVVFLISAADGSAEAFVSTMVAFGEGCTIPEGIDGICISISVDAHHRAVENLGIEDSISF